MKELDKPDLGLIKQENQGCGRFGNVCVHLARGRCRVQPTRVLLLLIAAEAAAASWRFK